MYYIDPNICPQDHICPLTGICPAGAISQNENLLPAIDQDKCIKCGKCARKCPKQAVKTA